jgi:uncharacterized protein with GYD domain
MAIFITQGNYTSDAIRGLMAKPEDRTEELSKLAAAAGGKLIAFYYTFGEHDFLMIGEGPSEKDFAASLLVAAASGTVTNLKTTVAINAADMTQAFGKAASIAGKFRPAGK